MECSLVGVWKIQMLLSVEKIDAWLVKLQMVLKTTLEVKRLLGHLLF
jgi:hypothetical protein